MAIIELFFDDNAEYLVKNEAEYSYLTFHENLEKCIKKNRNEILIELISNVENIKIEIDKIIKEIESKFNTKSKWIYFRNDNLSKISEIFCDFKGMANYYAEKNLNESNESIEGIKKILGNYNNEISEYKEAIANKYPTEEDEWLIIAELEEKYYKSFPDDIIAIYNDLNDDSIRYRDEKERKKIEDDTKKYNNYIINTYKEDFIKLSEEYIESYEKNIRITEKYLKKETRLYKKSLIKNATIYYESYINFLKNSLNYIYFLRNMVDAWFGINYDDSDFDWSSLTKEQRLGLEYIYANPFKNGVSIPNCNFLYSIKENNTIKFLSGYGMDKLVENKGKPFINIINDFKNKELVEIQNYACNDIVEVINVLFYQLKLSNMQVNKCKNCGKYFIPTGKSNEKYCDRISPQNSNKTCKEFGVNKTYREEMKSTPIKNEHNKISQVYRMRIKRAKNTTEKEKYVKEFEKYKTNYNKYKQKYKVNKISEKDFLNWLESQKG